LNIIQAVVYSVILIWVSTSSTTSYSTSFYPHEVIATSAVTILPDNEDGEELEDDSEEESSKKAIQPASNTDKVGHGILEHESDYQIVIPDGAAWDETISERFYPQEITVQSGSRVSWINEDDLAHSVTSGKTAGYGMYEFLQDGEFNSGNLAKGESFTFHFSEPGRFEYFCIPHPWMQGVVIVN
jgi:plastocyanin